MKCAFCEKEITENIDGWKCEDCGKWFCGQHSYWENHKCTEKISTMTDDELKKEIKKAEEVIGKPAKSMVKSYLLAGIWGAGIGTVVGRDMAKKRLEMLKGELKKRGSEKEEPICHSNSVVTIRPYVCGLLYALIPCYHY